jgi:DNA-binding HxlR family transcriptional regulator
MVMTWATYAELGDGCLTAHAMELIGHRWTYPILRELMLGPKRFSELLGGVLGLTPAVLTSRLREMSEAGLVVTETLPAPAQVRVYRLTTWAQALGPILQDLGRWAQKSPLRPRAGGLTPDAAAQAMVTMAGDTPLTPALTAELHLTDTRSGRSPAYLYDVRWSRTGLSATRGSSRRPAVVVHCDSSSWGRVLFDDETLHDVGAWSTGDPAEATRLVNAFRDTIAESRPS